MKVLINNFYVIFLFVLFISCDNSKNSKFKIESKVDDSLVKDTTFEHSILDTSNTDKSFTYYNNGNINKIFQLNKKGELHGYFKKYYMNGAIQSKIQFENGKKHGEYIMFSKHGMVIGYSIFYHGKKEYFLKRIGENYYDESFYSNGIRDSVRVTKNPISMLRLKEIEKENNSNF